MYSVKNGMFYNLSRIRMNGVDNLIKQPEQTQFRLCWVIVLLLGMSYLG